MKFGKISTLVSKNPLEMVLAVVLIIFILSPIEPPDVIANMIDSTLGIIVTSVLIVFLFVYSHTLLAILFVIAVFELIRRSSARRQFKPAVVTYTALQPATVAPDMGDRSQEPTAKHASSRSQTERPDKAFHPTVTAQIDHETADAALMGPPETRRPKPRRHEAPPADAVMRPPIYDHSLGQYQKDGELAQMNRPLMQSTLEEEAVHAMPMPNIEQDYLDSSYKPVYSNIHQASFA